MTRIDKHLTARLQTHRAPRALRQSAPRKSAAGITSAPVKVNPARDLIAAWFAVKAERGSVDDVVAKIKR